MMVAETGVHFQLSRS